MKSFLANPNVQHALARADMLDWVANCVAVDYLRHMNVDARPAAMAWLKTNYPQVHAAVRAQYPHHAG